MRSARERGIALGAPGISVGRVGASQGRELGPHVGLQPT